MQALALDQQQRRYAQWAESRIPRVVFVDDCLVVAIPRVSSASSTTIKIPRTAEIRTEVQRAQQPLPTVYMYAQPVEPWALQRDTDYVRLGRPIYNFEGKKIFYEPAIRLRRTMHSCRLDVRIDWRDEDGKFGLEFPPSSAWEGIAAALGAAHAAWSVA